MPEKSVSPPKFGPFGQRPELYQQESFKNNGISGILGKDVSELTVLEKKLLKNEKVTQAWNQIFRLALEQEYQQAYDQALT